MPDAPKLKQSSEDFIGAPNTVESLRKFANFISKSPLVTTKQLATILGITDRRILQLVGEGVFPKKGRNEFNLYECVHNYTQYVKRMRVKDGLGLDS